MHTANHLFLYVVLLLLFLSSSGPFSLSHCVPISPPSPPSPSFPTLSSSHPLALPSFVFLPQLYPFVYSHTFILPSSSSISGTYYWSGHWEGHGFHTKSIAGCQRRSAGARGRQLWQARLRLPETQTHVIHFVHVTPSGCGCSMVQLTDICDRSYSCKHLCITRIHNTWASISQNFSQCSL